ncbi:hypothetical protein ACH4SK_43190 [Streptomyces inhibens]|uniref:hypothetical protein n=1 Tax=Streptomyces inhibens TaxID=2293571 RepID=UPI00379A7CB5
MSLETIEKERAAHPVPEGTELDPHFETAEVIARPADRGPVSTGLQVNREMQPRLRAAGYEVLEQPLRDMMTATWARMDDGSPMGPEESARWNAAVGRGTSRPRRWAGRAPSGGCCRGACGS